MIFFCLLATAGCLPQPLSSPWVAADLRWVGGAQAVTPATDILAVYTHTSALTVEIRVDLLDINPGDQYSFRLSLWDNRSFYQEPLVIDLSSNGAVQTRNGNGRPAIWPRVIQNYGLDTIAISLNRFLIGNRYRMDVATYTTEAPLIPADEAQGILSDGQPPAARAPALLAFWDTFPAETPAQALRRWDGAHTGPLGGRDGLKFILDGSRQYKIPVALLDLKTPASLAALDYVGAMAQVRYMNEHGLLILPEAAYAEPGDVSLSLSRRSANGFGLLASQYVYDPASNIHRSSAAQFISLPDASHLVLTEGKRLIPLPSEDAVEATEDGPSLEVRRALVKAMLSTDPGDLVVLGGSLPRSLWGQADMAQPTFEWLAAHPWIKAFNGDDLMTFPAGGKYSTPPALVPQASTWLEALRSAPLNAASESAWQTYLSLNAPTNDLQLKALRADYLGQVGELLAAARWAESPSVQSDCEDDLDGDGQTECVLSNESYFAILDPSGARLANLFHVDVNGVHQLVGPTSQFAVGLSDPSEWKPEQGEAADPSVIAGAFADASDTWVRYTADITPGSIRFTSPDGSRVKTYRLKGNGIQVDYQASGPVVTRIPLAVDPQVFYSGPTNYRPAIAPHSWTWGLENGISVQVLTEAKLSAEGFVSSFPFLSMPEDPNLDYPKGHYMPFPLSIVTVQGEQNFSVQIVS